MPVRDSSVNGDVHSGDILFSALVILDGASVIDDIEQVLTIARQVHCLDQIVDVVVQQRTPSRGHKHQLVASYERYWCVEGRRPAR